VDLFGNLPFLLLNFVSNTFIFTIHTANYNLPTGRGQGGNANQDLQHESIEAEGIEHEGGL